MCYIAAMSSSRFLADKGFYKFVLVWAWGCYFCMCAQPSSSPAFFPSFLALTQDDIYGK